MTLAWKLRASDISEGDLQMGGCLRNDGGEQEEMSGGDVLLIQEMTDAVAHPQTFRPLTDTAGAELCAVEFDW